LAVAEVQALLQPPEERVALTRKEVRNKDRLKKKSYPIQTYALSGQEASRVTGTSKGKNTLDGPPMLITPTPPGAFGYSDDAWGATFGASMDAFLTLLPGWLMTLGAEFAEASYGGPTSTDSFAGIPNGSNLNMYKDIGSNQQIQFLVSKNKVETARSETKVSDYDDVRSIGVRGPIQMAGWGKTIGIRPTDPNPADKRKNDDEHKLDAASWKFGPVDMRWDSKRSVWRTFNELIVDQPLGWKDEGTLVFATNEDSTCGFPFLKGRLEQAWWVRKTCDYAGIIGDDGDRVTSGEVCTTILHKWYDDEYKCAAPMNGVFLIHRDPTCPVTCGAETTSLSTIEVKTELWFHMDMTRDGPIAFVKEDIEDNDIVGVMKFGGGVWMPVVQHDICSGGEKIYWDRTFINDITLARKICEICDLMLQLHGFSKGAPTTPGDYAGAAQKFGAGGKSAEDASNAFDDLPATGNDAIDSAASGAKADFDFLRQDMEAASASMDAAKEATEAANSANEAWSQTNQDVADARDARDAAEAATKEPGAGPIADAALKKAEREYAEAGGKNSEAREAAREASDAAAKAKTDAKKASDKAAKTADMAEESQKEWEEAIEKAGPPHPTDAEKEAKDKADKAIDDANEATDAGENAAGEKQSPEDCCKKNAAAIEEMQAALGGEKGMEEFVAGGGGVSQEDMDKAIDEAHEKTNTAMGEMTGAFNDANAETVGVINEQLQELGATGVDSATATAPVIGQDASSGGGTGKGGETGGETDEGEGTDGGETDTPKPPDDGGKDGPGSVVPPPPGSAIPPVPPKEPLVTPPDPPDCGSIDLMDPCSGKHKIISCKGGKSGGDPGGDGTGKAGDTTETGETSGKTGEPGPTPKPGLTGGEENGPGLGGTAGGWLF